jgi:hypothetical protein
MDGIRWYHWPLIIVAGVAQLIVNGVKKIARKLRSAK